MANERKYFCNSSMKFNLDSMYTHVKVAEYRMIDGEIDAIEVCGGKWTLDNIDELLAEIDDLLNKAVWGKVTGKEYGRIKAISEERQVIRYCQCIDAGMDENRAAYAFTD